MSKETPHYITHELQRSSSSSGSTKLEIVTNTSTGKSEIVLAYTVYQRAELNKHNLDVLKDNFKQLNPNSGWEVKIKDLIKIIN